MARRTPSLFRRLAEKDVENIREAVKAKKYWKLDGEKIYTIALSRARIRIGNMHIVRTASHGKVNVLREPAKYCRKYRILVLDTRDNVVKSVLTWAAFTEVMKKYSEMILRLAESDMLPPYINIRTLIRLKKKYSKYFPTKIYFYKRLRFTYGLRKFCRKNNLCL